MKTKEGYLQKKMKSVEYRTMRCLGIYLYYHDRRDLLWMHYSGQLRKGNLEACQALLIAYAQLKDREKNSRVVIGYRRERIEAEVPDLILQ